MPCRGWERRRVIAKTAGNTNTHRCCRLLRSGGGHRAKDFWFPISFALPSQSVCLKRWWCRRLYWSGGRLQLSPQSKPSLLPTFGVTQGNFLLRIRLRPMGVHSPGASTSDETAVRTASNAAHARRNGPSSKGMVFVAFPTCFLPRDSPEWSVVLGVATKSARTVTVTLKLVVAGKV